MIKAQEYLGMEIDFKEKNLTPKCVIGLIDQAIVEYAKNPKYEWVQVDLPVELGKKLCTVVADKYIKEAGWFTVAFRTEENKTTFVFTTRKTGESWFIGKTSIGFEDYPMDWTTI
jgi:hypothetical protein